MVEYTIEQPQPFDPTIPRYYPQRLFPSYRHIPGITPHPFYDPGGHSYGLQEEDTDVSLSLPDEWHNNKEYLYGVDLYNFAYWWEAGEVWEGLWKRTEGNCRLFLQGLIQISVSLLKYHTRKLQGLKRLSTSGRNKLCSVVKNADDPLEIYMGINLNGFLTCLDEFFSPFFSPTVSNQTYYQITVKPLIYLHF
jgi:uncharacterized protein